MNTNIAEGLTKLVLFWGAIQVIGFIAGTWLLYFVIKSAIRDGIKESGLVRHWPMTTQSRPDANIANLPEMKAER